MVVLMERHRDPLMGFWSTVLGGMRKICTKKPGPKSARKSMPTKNEVLFGHGCFKSLGDWSSIITEEQQPASRLCTRPKNPTQPLMTDQPDQQVAAAQIAAIFDQAVEEMDPKMAEVVDGVSSKD